VWKPLTLDGNKKSGNWYVGNAFSHTQKEALYPDSDPSYFLSYVFHWTGTWKCGCRDGSSCGASGKWQIQRAP
jgi:hypothetical protein